MPFSTSRRLLRILAAWLALCHSACLAAPHGASIGAGDATVSTAGNLTEVRQSTDRAIINWQGFSTNAAETVRFHQPSSSAVTLNRVVSVDPSILNGALEANGKLFLINPNGIVFGPGSQVNVGSLVASTLGISDSDFLAGRYRMVADPGKPLAAIVNQGTIRAARGGTVALLAPVVSNQGQIVAIAGRVVLAAGASANLELDSGLVTLEPGTGPKRDVVVGSDGEFNPLEQAVNNGSLVEAGSVRRENGRVILGGAEGLALNTGQVRADGDSGGQAIVRSTQATVQAPGAVISANATAAGGQGGTVRALSHGLTATYADSRMEARGGEGGQGGLVEASGNTIALAGRVDTSAPGGLTGTYLIDPATLTITNGADQMNLAGGTLGSASATTTLTVGTINAAAQDNNIVLEATAEIQLNQTDAINVGSRSFTLRVLPPTNGDPASITKTGAGSITAGSITIQAGTTGNPASNATISIADLSLFATGSGTVSISAVTAGTANLALGRVDAGSTTIGGSANAYSISALNATRGNVTIDPTGTPMTTVDGILAEGTVTLTPNAAISLGQITAGVVNISTSGGNIVDNNAGTANVVATNSSVAVANVFSLGGAAGQEQIDFTVSGTLGLSGGPIYAANSTNAAQLNVVTAPGQDVVVSQANSTLSRTGGVAGALALARTGGLAGVNVSYREILATPTDFLHLGVFDAGTGTVSITSDGSSVRGATGVTEMITAASLAISAATNIGQFAGDRLDTAVASFAALTSGAGTFINQTGPSTIVTASSGGANFRFQSNADVTISGAVNGANVAELTSTAGSLFTSGAGRLTAVEATLTAAGTIGSADSAFAATIGRYLGIIGPNGVFISNASGTQIDVATSALGNFSFSATGDIVAAGAITATTGDLSLTRTGGGSITGAGMLTGRNVSLRAGTLGGGAALVVLPSGALTLTGDAPGSINVLANLLPTSLTVTLAQTGAAVKVMQGVLTLLEAAAGGSFSGTSAIPVALTLDTGNLAVAELDTGASALTLTASAGAILSTPGTVLRGGALTLNASGGIRDTAGNAALVDAATLAFTAGGAGSGVILEDLTAVTVNSSTANGDVSVTTRTGDLSYDGDVTAGGLVRLTASTGSIRDLTAGSGRITGNTARLSAASGLGTVDNPLELQVARLEATATAGSAQLKNAGDLSVDSVQAAAVAFVETAGGNLTLGNIAAGITAFLSAPGGRLIDGNGAANNVIVNDGLALLRAATGIGAADDRIETHAAEIDARTTSGGIHLTEADAVRVRSAAAPGGSIALDVVTGHLTIEQLTARDDIALTTTFGTLFDGNGTGVNLTASTATFDIICEVGTAGDPIEVALTGNLNATAFGVHVDSAGPLRLGAVRPTFTSTIRSGGNLVIGRVDVNQGTVRLESTGGSIVRAPGSGTNLTVIGAATVEMVAAGTIGATDPLRIDVNPGILSVRAGDAVNGVSASFNGTLEPFQFVTVDAAPGAVLLNGAVSAPPQAQLLQDMVPDAADPSQTIVTVSAGNSGTTAVTAGVSSAGAGVPALSDLISIDFAP